MLYLILLLATISIALYSYFRVPKHLANIPRISFIEQLKSFRKSVLTTEYYEKVVHPVVRERGYGVRWLRGQWGVVVSKPEIAKDLFKNGQQFFKIVSKDQHSLFSRFVGSPNIVASNGEEWKRLRKPANPIFHQTFQPEIFVECVKETINAFAARTNENGDEAVPVADLMELMTLDVFGKGIFSHDFEAVKSLGTSEYHTLYSSIMKNLISPIYFLIPFLERFPIGKRAMAHKDVDKFNQFIQGLIDQRRKDLQNDKFTDSKDLLSTMLREDPDNTYAPLTDKELINNLNIFFIAGHDTTANTLSYAMYHLAKNQHVQDKLRAEIYSTLQVDPKTKDLVIPTSEQLKSMNYLACFIKEVMRITPAVLQVNRELQSDYTIPTDKVVLPKGTQVMLSIYSIQHDPKIYPKPEEFDPERFLVGKYDTDIYMPFGGGTRMCVGMNFSLMEQKVYLSLLLQKFALGIKENNPDFDKLRIKGLGLTRPKDLKVNLTPRF